MRFKTIATLLAVAGLATAQTTELKTGKAHIQQGMSFILASSSLLPPFTLFHSLQRSTKGRDHSPSRTKEHITISRGDDDQRPFTLHVVLYTSYHSASRKIFHPIFPPG